MTSPQKTRSSAPIWIGALAVVLILALVAIIASRGGDDDKESSSSGSKSSPSEVSKDIADGTITAGQALPAYDATQATDPAVGETMPSVTGKDFDGNDITIDDDGKAKVIVFVAHWCPHCQAEVPVLVDHLNDNPMPDDVELLTVSTAVQPGADNYPPQEWLEREGWEAPVLADDDQSSVANAYGLSSFPYFVVVDADGKIVKRQSGELSPEQFDALVEAAQTGSA